MEQPTNAVNELPATMRAPLRAYVEQIRELGGTNAKALAVFGKVVSGPFDPKHHTIRNVLIVERYDIAMLRRLGDQGVRLGKSGIAAPLTMTPAYIAASLDTFPLEIMEIAHHHRMLFGDDPFDGLAFENPHIRLQCERELKTVLIGLRQGLLAAAGREKVVAALQRDVGTGLLRTLRGMCWLRGDTDPMPPDRILAETEKHIDRRLNGLRTALDPAADHGWATFEAFYGDVEALGEMIDGW